MTPGIQFKVVSTGSCNQTRFEVCCEYNGTIFVGYGNIVYTIYIDRIKKIVVVNTTNNLNICLTVRFIIFYRAFNKGS